ncbi:hypothetical protein Emag_005501 [Eimeria magna]
MRPSDKASLHLAAAAATAAAAAATAATAATREAAEENTFSSFKQILSPFSSTQGWARRADFLPSFGCRALSDSSSSSSSRSGSSGSGSNTVSSSSNSNSNNSSRSATSSSSKSSNRSSSSSSSSKMSLTPQQQEQLLHEMRQQLQNGTADIEACSKKLQQLKLLQLGTVATAAVPAQGGDVSALLLARSTFETAAMLCVYTLQQQQQQQQQPEDAQEEMMAETAEAFQRHMNMLLPFYVDLAHVLPPSDMQLELECLQLLHFLSSDCIAELHVAFDRLSNEARESPYIVSVMRLEQRLMAGDFEAVMQQQQQQEKQQQQHQQQQPLLQLPRSACVFLSQLTKTVRLLIAAALEASYESLPLDYACRTLHLPMSSLEAFCEDQNRRRRLQGDRDSLISSPSLELAAAAAADATAATAPPRLLQQQQHQQPQSASALAAGVGSGSFASAVSFERASPLEVQWSIKGDRVVFAKSKPPTQHCAFHATQVAAHLIATAAATAPAAPAAAAATAAANSRTVFGGVSVLCSCRCANECLYAFYPGI